MMVQYCCLLGYVTRDIVLAKNWGSVEPRVELFLKHYLARPESVEGFAPRLEVEHQNYVYVDSSDDESDDEGGSSQSDSGGRSVSKLDCDDERDPYSDSSDDFFGKAKRPPVSRAHGRNGDGTAVKTASNHHVDSTERGFLEVAIRPKASEAGFGFPSEPKERADEQGQDSLPDSDPLYGATQGHSTWVDEPSECDFDLT